MKPLLIETTKKTESSFEVLDYKRPYFHNPIHYHSTIELTLIIQGEGTRIAGDHIEFFQNDDLILLGANLPHQWKDDLKKMSTLPLPNSKAIVIHFNENCLGEEFFKTPESLKIQLLLQKAKRGLKISGKTHQLISKQMHLLLDQTGFTKILTLLKILNVLSESQDLTPLASISYRIKNKESEIEKLDKIYEYVLDNLHRKITLSEMATKFYMSRTGFCRYFKTHTQKTFSRFVLEARISIACNLLQKNVLSVSQVAYESGFNQLSFFNREFKFLKGTTPLKYRKKILQKVPLTAVN